MLNRKYVSEGRRARNIFVCLFYLTTHMLQLLIVYFYFYFYRSMFYHMRLEFRTASIPGCEWIEDGNDSSSSSAASAAALS
jgi:hypothetical protein